MPAQPIPFRIMRLFTATTFVAMSGAFVTLCRSLCLTHGLDGVFYSILLAMITLPAVLGLCFSATRSSCLIAIVIIYGMVGIPQSAWLRELRLLRAEVAEIISYVEARHADQGRFPMNLDGYRYQRPELRDRIEYYPEPTRNSYYIWFNPTGIRSYGHYYYRDRGYWFEDD